MRERTHCTELRNIGTGGNSLFAASAKWQIKHLLNAIIYTAITLEDCDTMSDQEPTNALYLVESFCLTTRRRCVLFTCSLKEHANCHRCAYWRPTGVPYRAVPAQVWITCSYFMSRNSGLKINDLPLPFIICVQGRYWPRFHYYYRSASTTIFHNQGVKVCAINIPKRIPGGEGK